MIHSIKNNILKISVKQTGAELCSIESIASGKEFMWQGNPDIWANHSPVLFPIVGGLKNNTYIYKGKEYNLPRHGFIRNNQSMLLDDEQKNSLTFKLAYSDELLKNYPFKFEFKISYKLVDNTIEVSHHVINKGDENMLFSLGAHPAFNCPLNEGENYEDYYLEFEKAEILSTCKLNTEGLISDEKEVVMDNANILPLHKHLFDHDALVFKNAISRTVALKNKKSTNVVMLNFSEFPFLGIWAKPQASFVCIEPWLGIADSWNTNQQLTEKEGIISLNPFAEFKATYTITVQE